MPELRRRRWVRAPIGVDGFDEPPTARQTSNDDDEAIATLLERAYTPASIDFDPNHDFRDELRTWRDVEDADDDASRVLEASGEIVAAVLIARELGAPFLYEIAVRPEQRRHGVARALLRNSLGTLAARGEEMIAAWVTNGNVGSERLLASSGWVPVKPRLDRAVALGLYRGAEVVDSLDTDDAVAIALEPVDNRSARVWLVSERGHAPITREVGGVDVAVQWVAPTSSELPEIAATSVPMTGATWLLSHHEDRRTEQSHQGRT
ncbi:MAG: GNAT family N-acetyltransferase [Acidimicrobiia bacterium]